MDNQLQSRLKSTRNKVVLYGQAICHKGEHAFHAVYLGAVATHSDYRYAAAALLGIIAIGFLLKLVGEGVIE